MKRDPAAQQPQRLHGLGEGLGLGGNGCELGHETCNGLARFVLQRVVLQRSEQPFGMLAHQTFQKRRIAGKRSEKRRIGGSLSHMRAQGCGTGGVGDEAEKFGLDEGGALYGCPDARDHCRRG